jgi:hypothetical protein
MDLRLLYNGMVIEILDFDVNERGVLIIKRARALGSRIEMSQTDIIEMMADLYFMEMNLNGKLAA